MSIEFKMSRGNNGRKSRLYKRTKRASLNRIVKVSDIENYKKEKFTKKV